MGLELRLEGGPGIIEELMALCRKEACLDEDSACSMTSEHYVGDTVFYYDFIRS